MNSLPNKLKTRKESGYAGVLGILLMAAVILSVLSLYDVGQVTTHKIRGQNTADASAYSVAVVVSRDLNFIATTNRAMVANQVAIGQMVGLSSYGHMIEQVSFNIDVLGKIAGLIPGVGPVIANITKALQKGGEAMKNTFDKVAQSVIPINDSLIGVLSVAQHTFHFSMLVSSKEVYDDVVKVNDPEIERSFVLGSFTVAKFIKEHADTLERNGIPKDDDSDKNKRYLKRFDEFEKVVLDSRDPFLRSRSGKTIAVIHRYGGNEFRRREVDNRYVWEWTAMDTMSAIVPPCTVIAGCLLDAPLGWGAGHVLFDGKKYEYKPNFSRWGGAWKNKIAAGLAAADDNENNLAKTRSLRPFYDLKKDGMIERGPAMVSVLKKPLEPIRQWKEVANSTPNYTLQERFDINKDGGIPKNQILSIGKAEPYFVRPHDLWARGDGNVEFGNMYNPFWRPRLIETTHAERAAVIFAAAGVSL